MKLDATVFYRITDAAASVYRIQDIDHAIHTASTSIVRSAAGKLELDELQSSRESMNEEIAENLQNAATIWGIEITRTEISGIGLDDLSDGKRTHDFVNLNRRYLAFDIV